MYSESFNPFQEGRRYSQILLTSQVQLSAKHSHFLVWTQIISKCTIARSCLNNPEILILHKLRANMRKYLSYVLSRRLQERRKREAQISNVIQSLFSIRALITSAVTYKSREHVRNCNAWNYNKEDWSRVQTAKSNVLHVVSIYSFISFLCQHR